MNMEISHNPQHKEDSFINSKSLSQQRCGKFQLKGLQRFQRRESLRNETRYASEESLTHNNTDNYMISKQIMIFYKSWFRQSQCIICKRKLEMTQTRYVING